MIDKSGGYRVVSLMVDGVHRYELRHHDSVIAAVATLREIRALLIEHGIQPQM